MTDIKPIQTHYKGYHFRSRLEARWAVFFDALGLQWEYEPEGFDIPHVGQYLPDFWLPKLNEVGVWAEIKPSGSLEMAKAVALARHTKTDVLFLNGMSDYRAYKMFSPIGHSEDHYIDGLVLFHPKYLPGGLNGDEYRIYKEYGDKWCQSDINGLLTHYGRSTAVTDAVVASRSARFEHGQSGATL